MCVRECVSERNTQLQRGYKDTMQKLVVCKSKEQSESEVGKYSRIQTGNIHCNQIYEKSVDRISEH